ncbi:MAG: serine protease [Arachidicoccus sp.]|nr:serine protease [Arachidicoccus sp.]
MSEFYLTESIERYINGEMLPEEKAYFEQMRAQNPELNQMIAEHRSFTHTLSSFANNKSFKAALNDIHNRLVEENVIPSKEDGLKITWWQRYRKITGIAACIAGLTALIISGVISFFTPNKIKIEQLSRQVNELQKTQAFQSSKITEVTKMPKNAVVTSGGSAFLIDGEGYLVTNAHVLKGSHAVVANNDGHEFNTDIIFVDNTRDLAVLKITDKDYKPSRIIPYDIKGAEEDLGTDVFTLGYPTNDVTYNKGYISALKGFNGDTSTFSISLLANPGNSGGPVFNRNGDVIGILSTREANAQGVTFVIKSKEVFKMLKQWRDTDSSAIGRISVSNRNNLKGYNRVEQINKLSNYVFNVKAYN